MKKYRKLNLKIGGFFLILVILVAVGMGALVYRVNYNDSLNFSTKQMIKCGNYINDTIITGMIDTWLQDGKDDAYVLTEYDLKGIQREFELSYISVYRPCMDANGEISDEVVFIFDLNPENDTTDPKRELGEHVVRSKEHELIKEMFRTGEPQTTDMFKETVDGKQMMAFVPLKLDDGSIYGVILIACRMDNVQHTAANASIMMVAISEAVIVVFAMIMLIYLNRRVIRPINLLSDRMNHFVTKGHEFDNSYVTQIHTRDELEQMADNFNSMADSIVKFTGDLRQATAAQERMRAELDVAGSIRAAISSEITYPAFTERSDFDLCASLKNTVYNSCSFCNYFLIDEDHLLIVLGESVGKTLPSMLMSILASTNICALARMHVEPHRIAYETNNSLCGFERNDMSMTVSALIAQIELSTGVIKYVNAGMPPMIIKRTGEQYLSGHEEMLFNLGEMHGVSFEQNTIQLNQGETVFLTSHGVSELKNAYGEEFTLARATAAINEIASRVYPLNEMIDMLENELDVFGAGAPRELDTTILGFRYLG